MFVLDLFNTKFERELNEGGVDNLEARRIDTLNDRMQELLARAREDNYKNNPAALVALKKQFQQVKDERDSYYKVREGSVTPTATGLRHQARPGTYGGYEPERELKGLNKTLTKNLEKGMGIEFKKGGVGNRIQPEVDEAGIPGNVPTEKIPGKEDLLKGKGRSYYESQKKNHKVAEQNNPEDDDWYDDEEDQETDLRSGDYVRDQMDGESGEIFRMQGDPYERRVRILDRDGKGWYIEPSRLTRVDPTDPDVQRYFGKPRRRDMDEMDKSQPSQERHGHRALGAKGTTATPVAARKVVKDLAMDLDQAFAKQKPVKKKGVAEARPITSASDTTAGAKKLWQYIGRNLEDLASNADFDAERNELYINDRLNNLFKTADGQPVRVAFDMGSGIALDKGILYIPIGTIWQYRGMYTAEKFITDVVKALSGRAVKEGWSDAMVARRTGQPRTPYSVYIKGKKWKDFENEDHAESVANKLRAKFKAEGRDPSVITIAPTDYNQPIKEEQDTSGVESAIIRRIMVAHTDLLKQFGPDKVIQAAEEVAYNVGDVDEIGTSDVSAYVAQVKQILGATL